MYYPKSQIITNLYTPGDEFVSTSTNLPYIGYYHIVSTGEAYTGINPQQPNISLLIQFSPPGGIIRDNINSDNIPINQINFFSDLQPNEIFQTRLLPTPIQTQPTQQDKDLGVFSRYFCKKNNENLYIEIDKEQFTNLQNKDKNIAWDLYTPKQVLWQIKGDKSQTYNANKNNISLIEQRDKWYGFTQYFKDRFLKYYLAS